MTAALGQAEGNARALLRDGAAALGAAGIENPRREAALLLAHAAGLEREDLLRDPARPLSAADKSRYSALIRRRAAHEPFAYLTGEREFRSLSFHVGPAVLVPRPDSETLIDAAREGLADHHAPDDPPSVLDLGTGSGCLLLSFLHEWPGATGLGVDVSRPALALARKNAAALGLSGRATFCHGDWRGWGEGPPALPGAPFDLVLCNPPYIAHADLDTLMPDIRAYEPRAALDGGADGLQAYRTIAPVLPRLLRPGGRAVIETGAGQVAAAGRILRDAGAAALGVRKDLSGIERCILAVF